MTTSILSVGIIGAGDMGKLYAQIMAKHYSVFICDLPANYEKLAQQYANQSNIHVLRDGFQVSRQSDFIIYSVEAAHIQKCVETYGPASKLGAIVAGQTSVKEPEIKAFEAYLPPDVHIVSCHSLHGPMVNPAGQPLVIIRHRADDAAFAAAESCLAKLGSNMVYLSYLQHDIITADTQAVTHLAFLSMGTAWKQMQNYPWENRNYVGGIENVKTLMALRIYGNKWHVYGGLAILNPSAQAQVKQYSRSISELFKLMIQEKSDIFRERVYKARAFVFGEQDKADSKLRHMLLTDSLLDDYSLGAIPQEMRKPNSHLSLLSMVDCWYHMNIKYSFPFDHLICQTPPFRLMLGIAEYLFCNRDLLDSALTAALYDKEIRADDMEFFSSVQRWADIIELRNMEGYQRRFEETADFFRDRLPQASKVSSELINRISKKI